MPLIKKYASVMDKKEKYVFRFNRMYKNPAAFSYNLNRGMKEVGKEIDEEGLTFYCGRHSFATLALSKGMPIESVSRVLGHTNIVTTQIYARITSQKLDNDLTMLGNKLNASFKNIKRT